MSKRDPWDEKTSNDQPKAFAMGGGEGIEMVLVHDEETGEGEPWRAAEVWTARSVYVLDSERVCVAVVDRQTNRKDPGHGFLKARLAGGQHREKEGMSVSHPFPLPGMDAVFEISRGGRTRYATTTAVERVVVRVRMTNVRLDAPLPQPAGVDAVGEETTNVWRIASGRWTVP